MTKNLKVAKRVGAKLDELAHSARSAKARGVGGTAKADMQAARVKVNKLTGRTVAKAGFKANSANSSAAASATQVAQRSSHPAHAGASASIKSAMKRAKPEHHNLQKGKKGGTFYIGKGGEKVYAKK